MNLPTTQAVPLPTMALIIALACVGCAGNSIGLNDDAVSQRIVGDEHIFTYTMRNQGQVDLTNVTMTASFSDGLEFVSSTIPLPVPAANALDKTFTWNLGTVKVDDEVTLSITARGIAPGEQFISTVTESDQLERVSDAGERVMFIDSYRTPLRSTCNSRVSEPLPSHGRRGGRIQPSAPAPMVNAS